MANSIGSIGDKHPQKGAGGDRKNQPGSAPGQKMADQPMPRRDKPDGGADQGPRSVR